MSFWCCGPMRLILDVYSALDVTGDCSWTRSSGWRRQQETIIPHPREHGHVLEVCWEWLQGQRRFWLYCFEGFRCYGRSFLVVWFYMLNLYFEKFLAKVPLDIWILECISTLECWLQLCQIPVFSGHTNTLKRLRFI